MCPVFLKFRCGNPKSNPRTAPLDTINQILYTLDMRLQILPKREEYLKYERGPKVMTETQDISKETITKSHNVISHSEARYLYKPPSEIQFILQLTRNLNELFYSLDIPLSIHRQVFVFSDLFDIRLPSW